MLKVLNINFRSLNNPQTRDEFHTLLDQTNPDIVIGSETWLNSDINNAEIVPDDMMMVDTGKLDTRSVPAKNINNQPVMPDIKVSENGVLMH